MLYVREKKLHTMYPGLTLINMWSLVDVFRNRVRLVKRYRASSAPTLQMIPNDFTRVDPNLVTIPFPPWDLYGTSVRKRTYF